MRLRLAAAVVFTAAIAAATQAFQPASSKIWLGRNAEIETFIREAKTVGEEDIKVGVTRPHKLRLEPGGPVGAVLWSNVHGRYMGYWDSWRADIAAYEIDKLLRLDMVPPVVEKRYNSEPGRASMWVEHVKMWNIKDPVHPPDRPAFDVQVVRMKMFDNFVGNTDRNQGNLLVDQAFNLILIDHTRAFTAGNKLVIKMTRVDRELWERMLAITEPQLTAAVGKWLMGGQIKDVFRRRELMKKEIESLIPNH
jgi:hypothetical protein